MLALLRQPRWSVGLAIVVLSAVGFATAGVWQLNRLEQRRERNATIEEAQARDPVPIGFDSLPLPEFSRVTASGSWIGDAEVAIPLRSRDGRAGVHLVTPLLTDGAVILVDRGWVPLDEVASYPRASGMVEMLATVRAVPSGRATGGLEGGRPAVSRPDPGAVAELSGLVIANVVVDLITEAPAVDPAPLPPLPPEITEGNHLLYAIQWFSFIAIVGVGFVLLVRKRASELGEPVDDLRVGE